MVCHHGNDLGDKGPQSATAQDSIYIYIYECDLYDYIMYISRHDIQSKDTIFVYLCWLVVMLDPQFPSSNPITIRISPERINQNFTATRKHGFVVPHEITMLQLYLGTG